MPQLQPANTTLTPEERYAQKVVNYSTQNAHIEYFSGLHYSRLGSFLISPYKSFGEEWARPIPENTFQSVTVCNLTKKHDDITRTQSFSETEEFKQYLRLEALGSKDESTGSFKDDNNDPGSLSRVGTLVDQSTCSKNGRHEHSGRMVFLRGFSSAQWLNCLGAQLDVDPEFLYRHLDGATGVTTATRSLAVPFSAPFPWSRDLMQLRVCNIGSWDPTETNLSLASLRQDCQSSFERHLEDFTHLKYFNTGDSTVRQFILHDVKNFSIEQRITIEVIHHTQPWSVVVWMDSGRDLGNSMHGPWVPAFKNIKATTLHPVFQHRPRMALSEVVEKPEPIAAFSNRNAEQSYSQSINHLHKGYGRYLKPQIMKHDVFYALNEIFEFSAASIDQLLELFEHNIRVDMHLHRPDAAKVSELLVLKTFLDDYRSYLADTLDIVQSGGNPAWPRVAEVTLRKKADLVADQLKLRYQRLLAKCDRLLDRCNSGIGILMNLESQQQTSKSMVQADRLGKLSFLAYIYIPITFAASFYGMNFRELGTDLSIWTFFTTAVILFIISMVAWFFDVWSACKACWRAMRRMMTWFH